MHTKWKSAGTLVAATLVTAGLLAGSASADLDSANNQRWTQDSPGIIAAGAEEFDEFGKALATGDFDGDGFDDLAIGAPLENVGATSDAGLLHVLYGAPGGLSANGNQVWTRFDGTPAASDLFAASDSLLHCSSECCAA